MRSAREVFHAAMLDGDRRADMPPESLVGCSDTTDWHSSYCDAGTAAIEADRAVRGARHKAALAAARAGLGMAIGLLRDIDYHSPTWHDRRTDFLRDHRGFSLFHDFHAELAAARRLVGDWMRSHPHDPLSAASARAVTGARFEYPEAIQPSKEKEVGR